MPGLSSGMQTLSFCIWDLSSPTRHQTHALCRVSMESYPLNHGGIPFSFFDNLFLAVLGLHCCTGFSLVAVSGGYSLVTVLSLLIVVTSLGWSTGSRVLRLQ